MAATSTAPPAPSHTQRQLKPALWTAIAAMMLFVIFYSEIPIFRREDEHALFRQMGWLLVPHILAGATAFLLGPVQFSTRLRTRRPRLHRLLGRTYVYSVLVAAVCALALAFTRHPPQEIYFHTMMLVQAGAWIITTGAALLTARNRQFQQHREWMFRSYAITLTFIATRLPQPIHAWTRMSRAELAIAVIIITFGAILLADLAVNWHALTTRRACEN